MEYKMNTYKYIQITLLLPLLIFFFSCIEHENLITTWEGDESFAQIAEGYLIGFYGTPDKDLILDAGGRVLHAYNNFPILHIDVPEHALRELENNPNVRFIERNSILYTGFQDNQRTVKAYAMSHDPHCPEYDFTNPIITDHLKRIGAEAAWDKNYKGAGIRVAVLSSGIKADHVDLDGNVDLVNGFTKYTTGPPRNRHFYVDTEGWGTLNAGVIGANGTKLFGVAPEVTLVSVKIMMNNTVPMDWVIEGIDTCFGLGVNIIQMGFGYFKEGEPYTALEMAVERAWQAGMLLVASVGNIGDDGVTTVRYPAAFDNVIGVSAANAEVDDIAGFSRYGAGVSLIAPGENTFTTYIDNYGYLCRSGTAYSAGYVAGAAALVWSKDPTLENWQVRDVLLDNTELLDGVSAYEQGAGLLRVDKALGIVGDPPVFHIITATAGEGGKIVPSGDVSVKEGDNQTFNITAEKGYKISEVMVDGNILEDPVTSYTFEDVTADHTIHASFAEVPTYTITATAGEGGTINPLGEVVVNEGANQTFNITANAGYQIFDVLVDDLSAGAVSSYTFYNVSANRTIHATFEEEESVPLSIDRFDLTRTSNPQFARVRVDWAVSGENLSTVVVNIEGEGNKDSRTWNVSGSSASGTHEFSFRRGFGTYTVTLTVTDTNGIELKSKPEQITL